MKTSVVLAGLLLIRAFYAIMYFPLRGEPSQGSSATPRQLAKTPIASYCGGSFPTKIRLISSEPMAHISNIKLIRTDTTLDLSQKAEKEVEAAKRLAKQATFDCFLIQVESSSLEKLQSDMD
ncbi:hypothetical protein CTI12_AA406780 [Artemisia annua]|uniref:Uncharacterized protein n=1 Tax=Artemisia annua TaxID=35608 RepID=A0A2U1M8I4_ARTAN|nr:hypothetical protein CTI12_AA406780 [Artemisia annua]